MDKIIVTAVGITGIIFIYRFFFAKKEEAREVSDATTIIVDGGYKPNAIKIKQGKSLSLTFIRKDSNPCLEEIVFPDYKIKQYLPRNKPVTVTLSPPHPQTSQFHCGMNMFRGKIIALE